MTSTTETYNGWTNYATWRINLEILDDHLHHGGIDGETFTSAVALAAHLEEYVDEVLTGFGEITEGWALNYARAFVSDVDFREIAEHAIADNPDLLEAEEEEEI